MHPGFQYFRAESVPEMSNEKKQEGTLIADGLCEPGKAGFNPSLESRSKTSVGGKKLLQHLHGMFGKAGDDNGVLLSVQSQLKEHRKYRSENRN